MPNHYSFQFLFRACSDEKKKIRLIRLIHNFLNNLRLHVIVEEFLSIILFLLRVVSEDGTLIFKHFIVTRWWCHPGSCSISLWRCIGGRRTLKQYKEQLSKGIYRKCKYCICLSIIIIIHYWTKASPFVVPLVLIYI